MKKIFMCLLCAFLFVSPVTAFAETPDIINEPIGFRGSDTAEGNTEEDFGLDNTEGRDKEIQPRTAVPEKSKDTVTVSGDEKKVDVSDDFVYSDLKEGEEYVLKATLTDKNTDEVLDTVFKSFVAEKGGDGTVRVYYKIDNPGEDLSCQSSAKIFLSEDAISTEAEVRFMKILQYAAVIIVCLVIILVITVIFYKAKDDDDLDDFADIDEDDFCDGDPNHPTYDELMEMEERRIEERDSKISAGVEELPFPNNIVEEPEEESSKD